MKKLFVTLTIFFMCSSVFAQVNTVEYTFTVQLPTGLTIDVANGTFQEGDHFELTPNSGMGLWQPVYDALVGSQIGFSQNAIDEDIEIFIKLTGLDPVAATYTTIAGQIVFLYVEIAVVAGGTIYPPDQNYNFNPGGNAYLKIPMTPTFMAFLNAINLNPVNGLSFAYLHANGNWTLDGITTSIIPGQPDTLHAQMTHFSKIGGGGTDNLTSVGSDINAIPDVFKLDQNYPNPFNPSTRIKYSIVEEGFVTLKVYNAIGKEIKTLVSKKQPAGVYEVSFDASSLPSGVYFYTLMSNANVQTRKMILVK